MWFISAEKIKDVTTIAIISAICLLMSPTVLGLWESKADTNERISDDDGFSYAINYAENDNVPETGGKFGATSMSYVFVGNSTNATKVENIPDEIMEKITAPQDDDYMGSAEVMEYSALDRNKIIFEEDKSKAQNTSEIIQSSGAVTPETVNLPGRKVSKKIADSEIPLAAIKLNITDYRDFRKIEELNFRSLMEKYNKHINFYKDDRTTMNMILKMLNKDN